MGTEKREIKQSTIRRCVWLLLVFLLISLAFLLISFLTTHLVDFEFQGKVNDVLFTYKAHLGVWEVCVGIKGTETVCSDGRDQGSPFDEIYSQDVRVLSVVALCLYLPSIVGLTVLAIKGENLLLTLLTALTVAGSVGTGVAALSVFTDLVKSSEAFIVIDVTYSWSYILGWVALGIIVLIVIALLTCLIYCQCRVRDFEDYEDEVKLQMKSSTDRGLYNPAYVLNADMSRSTIKDRDRLRAQPYQAYDENFHYKIEDANFMPYSTEESRSTIKDRDRLRAQPYQAYDENFHYKIEDANFMPYSTEESRSSEDRVVIQSYQYPNRKEIYNPPETFLNRDDGDDAQPFPRQIVDVDYGSTIEIRPRQIQPTPTFLDEDMRSDYVSEGDTRPQGDDPTGRTFTISRVRPTMEVAGTPLEVGDTYVVSLDA